MPTFRENIKLGTKVPLMKTDDYSDKSVTERKLADSSVTNPKLASESVTIDKLDKELVQLFEAAAGLPESLIETIQNVDTTLADHQKQLDDKQQQITSNDEDIAALQDKTMQIKDTVEGIAVSGGASVASAVTYDNAESGLNSINIQNATDELQSKKFDKSNVVQETGDAEDKVMSQKAVSDKLSDINTQIEDIVEKRDSVYTIETNGNYLLAIVDKNRNCLGGITKTGKWYIPDGISDEAQTQINSVRKALQSLNDDLNGEVANRESLIRSGNASYSWAIADKNNSIWLAGTLDGEVIMPKGIPDEVKTQFASVKEEINKTLTHIEGIENIVKEKNVEGLLAALVDSNNNKLWSVDKEGNFTVNGKLESQSGYSIETVDAMNDTLYAIVDANRNVVFKVTNDRKIQAVTGINLGDNLSTGISLVDSNSWLYAIVDANNDVLGGIDKYGAMFANSIKGVCTVKQEDNDEWLLAFLDANGNVAFGIKKDGAFYASSVQVEGLPSEGESMTFLYVITDKDNHVLWGIMNSGKVYQPYGVPEEVKELVSKLTARVDTLDNYLSTNGVKTKMDFSDSSYIQIPEPRCAVINVTGISSMPTTKTQNKHGYIEFWDMQGNYFKKKVIANAQGNSSIAFIKKNAAFDFCDDDWVGDETPSIRFGDWVPQDSFHMKAYYTDFFRGVSVVSYRLYEGIVKTRGNRNDRPWKKELIDMSKIKATTNSIANPIQDDLTLQLDTGARCVPDGFPVICYLNGEFYGIFSWQLKKHRDNFHMDKKVTEQVHLDGTFVDTTMWDGTVAWDQFEVRNPKSLYCINTEDISGLGYTSLDATTDADEIAAIGENYQEVTDKPSDFTDDYIVSTYGDNPPKYLYRKKKDKWYRLVTLDGKQYLPYDGDNPTELIDETMPYYDASNKDHVRTAKVKSYIVGLSKVVSKLKEAETAYNASSKTADDLAAFKSVIETYCDPGNQMDFMIFSDVISNGDGLRKNWQWITYNGTRWYVEPYDCDMSFGGSASGCYISHPNNIHISTSKGHIHGYVMEYYKDEFEARYKELSDAGIISKDYIFNLLKDWTMRVGVDNYKKEYQKWPDSPCNGESVVRTDYWELQYNEDGTPKTADTETFDATTAYAIDDEVSFGWNSDMGYYCFKCVQPTTALETNTPHRVSTYSPISGFRYTDNIYRIEKWIETEIANMDKVYGYTRR